MIPLLFLTLATASVSILASLLATSVSMLYLRAVPPSVPTLL
jgi:hypothetical protein